MTRVVLHLVAMFSMLMPATLLYAEPANKNQRIPSQYIVVFKDNVDTDKTANKFLRRFSALEVNFRYKHALRGMAVKMPEQLVAKLAADPSVDYIEQDVYVSLAAQTLPTGVNRINADDDPVASIDGIDDRVDVDIAILDTGIDLDHPDLNVYKYAYCRITSTFPREKSSCTENDSDANDIQSHGTHVAGIAAAIDNTSGVVGVAPGARLWAVKVLDDEGNGAGSTIIAGVDYVAGKSNEIEVANMSLTGIGTFQALDDAIDGAISAGVVFVLAAGNDSVDVADVFPAGHPNSITVSALADYDGIAGGLSGDNEDDKFAYFSNYGAGVDIMAPGRKILSTGPGGGTRTKSGTSMSSPHIAGAAALYLSQNPTASPATVKAALLTTVDPSPCVNDNCGATQDPDGIQEPLILLSCYDEDGDGVCTDVDNCPVDSNTLQTDTDLDMTGNTCDNDDDNDGLLDTFEDSIGTDTLLVDTDSDGISDYDEVNFDGDPDTYTVGIDLNPLSSDTDGDGVLDATDVEPLTANIPGDLAPLGSPDGVVNAADYLIQIRFVQGELAPSAIEIQNGDLYSDGVINISDLILLNQLIMAP
jgi:subtilisin